MSTRMTVKPIFPNVLEVVRLFDAIHYRDVTDLLIHGGTWGYGPLPDTPSLSVNRCLTTSRDSAGRLIFERVGRGTYRVSPTYVE